MNSKITADWQKYTYIYEYLPKYIKYFNIILIFYHIRVYICIYICVCVFTKIFKQSILSSLTYPPITYYTCQLTHTYTQPRIDIIYYIIICVGRSHFDLQIVYIVTSKICSTIIFYKYKARVVGVRIYFIPAAYRVSYIHQSENRQTHTKNIMVAHIIIIMLLKCSFDFHRRAELTESLTLKSEVSISANNKRNTQ